MNWFRILSLKTKDTSASSWLFDFVCSYTCSEFGSGVAMPSTESKRMNYAVSVYPANIQNRIILVTAQLNAQILFFFIINLLYSSTCFEHCCAHHQEVKIVLYSNLYRHTCRFDDSRCSIIQF